MNAKIYDAHMEYDVDLDVELLNMKIRIFDESFYKTGNVLYEGSVGKFIKERIPSEFLVGLLIELRHKDKLSYVIGKGENFIERIR